MRIGYEGVPGAFSAIAAREHFHGPAEFVPFDEFGGIFAAVVSGAVDAGIVPIENSRTGAVHRNYDLLGTYDVCISGEHFQRVHHQLLAKAAGVDAATRLQGLRRVFSHPQALDQCRNFFERLPHLQPQIFGNTATAAKFVAECDDDSCAAIASAEAGSLYNLQVVAADIEDDPRNFTRFIAITRGPAQEAAGDKASVTFTLQHRPGALLEALQALAAHRANMTRIESRPIIGAPFEYRFYLDFELGGAMEPLLATLRGQTSGLKLLGRYVSAKLKG